jgi:hypothetical protein
VRDEAYAGPLRDWLGEEGKQALLILDEAHNAAQASGSKFAIDSKLTRSIRDLAGRFEHKLFLSATPHNGHSNSFSALLEILDPTRFCRGVDVRKQDLADVMVRRLKEDLRQIGVELPQRMVVPEVIDGLPSDNPELQLAELLSRYREQRNQRLAAAGKRERAAENLVIANLQKRLLSSIAAFDRTLQVHMATLEKRASKGGKRRPVRLEAASGARCGWRLSICSRARSMAMTSAPKGMRRSCCWRPMPTMRWRSPPLWKPATTTGPCCAT